MEAQDLQKRATLIKWYIVLALVPLAVLIVGSVPVIVAATGHLVPQWLLDKALFTTMFFVPLIAIFLMAPVIKSLGRSLLLWGLGIVLLPLGTYILGIRLVYLVRGARDAV
ncbi:hypothetical protein [Polaromonas aquatica]|uniref:hypothetical protein n=1 Tax=Polaromonas aquatica TaxID=332657 RepID=UPI003D64F74B